MGNSNSSLKDLETSSGAATDFGHDTDDDIQETQQAQDDPSTVEISSAVKTILCNTIGENSSRNGLVDTPGRFAKAWRFFTLGYTQTLEEVIGNAVFEEGHDGMVLIRDIEVYSLCEHHLVPFFGKAHVTYIPSSSDGTVIGLSKLGRLVDMFSRRLQVQERLTKQIHDAVVDALSPQGVGVILECQHLCMSMRGVEKKLAATVTSYKSGVFQTDPSRWVYFASITVGRNKTDSDISNTKTLDVQRDNLFQCQIVDSCAVEAGVADIDDSSLLPVSSQSNNSEQTMTSNDFAGTEASDYMLYLACAYDEFVTNARIIRDSLTGPILEKEGGFSFLDIGAGNGRLLQVLCEEVGVESVHHYSAFEENIRLCDELKKTVSKLGLLEKEGSYVRNETFSEHVTDAAVGGRFDLVLLSHSLYGTESKENIVNTAMGCVAPGGVLVILHRWGGGTLERLSRFLDCKNKLHHLHAYDVKLDLSDRSNSERQRLSRYTGGEIDPNAENVQVVERTMGCIAVEPHSCCTYDAQQQEEVLEKARKKVNWRARSKTPALVVTPNAVAGIQACVRGASLRTVGCGKVSVIGGGHSENGLHDNAIVIDMDMWNYVVVDPFGMTVRVGGGAAIGEITSACEKHGLIVPLGDRPGVGLGLILQGGLNHFMRTYGIACDNLLRVVYVSPTGKLEVADNDENLWQFRGAGTNFGVVIEVTLQAHKLESVWLQQTEIGPCGPGELSSVASCYAETATTMPENAALDCYLFWSSHKDVTVATSLFDTSREFLDRDYVSGLLRQDNLDKIKVSQSKPIACKPSVLFDKELYMTEAFAINRTAAPGIVPPKKVRSIKRAIFLSKTADWSILEMAIRGAPTKWCYVHIMPGGEAVKRMPESSFGCRSWDFAAVITARYPDGASDVMQSCESWIAETVDRLFPYVKGVYGSDLGPADVEMGLMAFGNHSRVLANMKRKLDPLNILSCGCPLLGPDPTKGPDLRVTNPGIVIVFCGRRCVGKDWLAEISKEILQELMFNHNGDDDAVAIARISDATKRDYAASCHPGVVDVDKLINDRQYKEIHRKGLTDFYNRQRGRDLACDVKSFQAMTNQHSQSGVLLVTGMRHGLQYARSAAGKAVVMIKVTSSDCSRRTRGWQYDLEIDDSEGENCVDSFPDHFWDVVYDNEAGESTKMAASSWVKHTLVPKMLNLSVRKIPDTPRVGIEFKDLVGSLLLQPFSLQLCCGMIVDWLTTAIEEEATSCTKVDAILSPEALGYVFAGALGARLMKPVILARKAGKLEGQVDRIRYNSSNITKLQQCGEVGGDDIGIGEETMSSSTSSALEIVTGSIQPGQKILIVDDCLASGATAAAIINLVQRQTGGIVTHLACIMEFTDLEARTKKLPDTVNCFSLLQYDGN